MKKATTLFGNFFSDSSFHNFPPKKVFSDDFHSNIRSKRQVCSFTEMIFFWSDPLIKSVSMYEIKTLYQWSAHERFLLSCCDASKNLLVRCAKSFVFSINRSSWIKIVRVHFPWNWSICIKEFRGNWDRKVLIVIAFDRSGRGAILGPDATWGLSFRAYLSSFEK